MNTAIFRSGEMMWCDVMMVLVDVMMVMVIVEVMMVLVDVMWSYRGDVMMVMAIVVMWRDDGQSYDDDVMRLSYHLINVLMNNIYYAPMINMHINRSVST